MPNVYWQHSSSEVLVLEYCPGVRVNDGGALEAMGLDRAVIARRAVESYLQQVMMAVVGGGGLLWLCVVVCSCV